MIDVDLVEKKLAFIDTCVRELHQLSQPERIAHDIREERFVAYTLQIAIQAALDVASHIVSDGRLGEPRTNRELFDLLQQHHWLSPQLTDIMRQLVGFRNIVVHGYHSVDLQIMRHIVEHRLDDLLAFTTAITTRLQA
jgi:uncharacterized protein YutE (UPF0331/DUF86 family)